MEKTKNKEVGIEIKMKGEDGNIVSFKEDSQIDDELGSNGSSTSHKKSARPKAKKKERKIKSEETLEMILNALKP